MSEIRVEKGVFADQSRLFNPDLRNSLKQRRFPSRRQVVLLSCGSFSPPTLRHLRNFEDARFYLESACDFEVVFGLLSPVHDGYGKESLQEVSSSDREHMLRLSTCNSTWLGVSHVELERSEWMRTVYVVEETRKLLINELSDVLSADFLLLFLCGADLLRSMRVPGKWFHPERLFADNCGIMCIERQQQHDESAAEDDPLSHVLQPNVNFFSCEPVAPNDISSSRVREVCRSGGSARYLVPDRVCDFIEQRCLYRE
ncbi:MAG: hypothetical protein MHM6MM_003744 [Cercozoa sp. M6MM]